MDISVGGVIDIQTAITIIICAKCPGFLGHCDTIIIRIIFVIINGCGKCSTCSDNEAIFSSAIASLSRVSFFDFEG